MPISVQNISATSATVHWPSAAGCLDTFYSIMYHPNWNSLLMGYSRSKSFLREDRVPVTQTTTYLGNLSPQTTYILCVTCRQAKPVREQCQVFNTLDEGPEADGLRRDLAMGVWLASSLLLLLIAMVLLWGCLHSLCPGREHWDQADGVCPTMCSPRQVKTLLPGGGAGGGEGGGGGGDAEQEGHLRDSSFYTPSGSEEEEDDDKEEDDTGKDGKHSQLAMLPGNPFSVKEGEKISAEPQGHELERLATSGRPM